MKLIRFGEFKKEKPGILLDDGKRKDLSAHFKDWDHDFFQNNGLSELAKIVRSKSKTLPDVADDIRLGSCIARPGKVVCIGLNYRDHAKETNAAIPSEPIVFMKGSNSVVGPNDNILIPRKSEKTDWEVELSLVIGKDARYLNSVEEANDYIAGFCICNDVSERAFQLEKMGQWVKGKSCDTFCPTGPFLATKDEIPDVKNLKMSLSLNGKIRQNGNTSTMIFDVYFLVHYLSQFMTLEAGDLLSTGTPPGVGMGCKPPEYLKENDVMELSVEGLGIQQQICKNA